jgi:PAS domain S-box-containing protein
MRRLPYIRRILAIDDDPDALQVLREYLTIEGYEVVAAPDGAAGVQLLSSEEVQLVITDLNMPGLSGMDVIDIVRRNYPDLQIIVVTGYGTMETVLEALHKGAIDYLVKPFLLEILKVSLGKAERQIEREKRLQERGAEGAPDWSSAIAKLPMAVALLDEQRQPRVLSQGFRRLLGDWEDGAPAGLRARGRERLQGFLERPEDGASLLLPLSGIEEDSAGLELTLHTLPGEAGWLLEADEIGLESPEMDGDAEEALLVLGEQGSLLWANAVAADWFDLDGDTDEDLQVAELIGGELGRRLRDLVTARLPLVHAGTFRLRQTLDGGGPQDWRLEFSPLLDERHRRRAWMVSLRPAIAYGAGRHWTRGSAASRALPWLRLDGDGRVQQASAAFLDLAGLRREELLGRSYEELLPVVDWTVEPPPRRLAIGTGIELVETARAARPEGLLVELGRPSRDPLADRIEEQKAQIVRATSRLSHLLGTVDPDRSAQLREQLDQAATALVEAGFCRRGALYLRSGGEVVAWGLAGYAEHEAQALQQDADWIGACEACGEDQPRIGSAWLQGNDAAEARTAQRWTPGLALVLPVLGRAGQDLGRLRIEEEPGHPLPGEPQVRLMELLLRQLSQSLDELELERQVAQSEARYRELYENAKYAILIVDLEDGRILDVNGEAERLTGYTRAELGGRRIWELSTEDYEDTARRNWLKTVRRETTSFENQPVRRKEGASLYVDADCLFTEIRGRPVLQCIYRDVTEKQALEFTLIQSQKLAGLGQLSAGVAHELRNPLGIIGSSLYFINSVLDKGEVKVPDMMRKHLGIIKSEVDRSKKIIENLLNFSRVSNQEREPVDLCDLLGVTLDLVRKELLVNNIRLVTEFEELPPVLLNLDELKQAFLNIILNATQAMPKGGQLRIRTRREGPRVLVDFEDTGVGISKENLPNVLNPFFTTKDPGVGTGLGLSLTHTFIRRAGGDLLLESEPGAGTTVRIHLPVADGPAHNLETP